MLENRKILTVIIPDATADKNFNVLRVPEKHTYTIEAAYVASNLDVAAHTANYMNVALMNGGTAGTSTDLISDSAGGTAGWALNVNKPLTIVSGSGDLTAGQVLVAKYDEEGTTAPGSLSLIVEYVDGIGSKA
jgi:hypothetical protein